MRNVLRHARTEGRCRVSVTARPGHVRVEVTDDGAGFVPSQLPLGRLGLRVAVRDRLLAVGGTARWTSAPGAGTTVTLLWPDPGQAAGQRAQHAASTARAPRAPE